MAIETHWSNVSEKGFLIGMKFLFGIHQLFGAWAFKIVLTPVLIYYFITNGVARRASMEYLQQVRKFHTESHSNEAIVEPTRLNSFKHFFAFGQSIIDKLGAWAGNTKNAEVPFLTRDLLLNQAKTGRGALLLGSHLGNLDIMRCLSAHTQNIHLNVLVHTKHASMINHLLEDLGANQSMELIQVTELTPATAIMLNERIERGEFITLAGDRSPADVSTRHTLQDFMGKTAPFPQGPFILAALLKCPVYTIFGLKINGQYQIFCDLLAEKIHLPRSNRNSALQKYVAQYAVTLGEYCLKAPLQWFNFYSFWQPNLKPRTSKKTHEQ